MPHAMLSRGAMAMRYAMMQHMVPMMVMAPMRLRRTGEQAKHQRGEKCSQHRAPFGLLTG
jgi:hypothetical protein